MNGSQAIEKRERRTPDELISEGKTQATALMKVVKEAGLAKDLGGSKPHLEVEAWQTIGRFNGYLTDIVWTKPIIEGGEKVGYEARAELVRIDDGAHVIGAEASCFFDEEIEKKDGTTYKRWTDDYAVRSMAQTRAQSKLGRMAFAWVAVLAGYSGTPAEEMDGVRKKEGKPIVFPFGKHKDKQPSELTAEELQGELKFWLAKLAEEKNPKFVASNQRLVSAIQVAIEEKKTKPESSAGTKAGAHVEEGEEPNVGTVSAPTRVDAAPPAGDTPSALDQAWAKVDELIQAKGWTKARLVKHVKDGFSDSNGDPRKLSLLNVQAIEAHLRTFPDVRQRELV